MAAPFANVTDLSTLWRPLSLEEQTRAAAVLVAASAVIRGEVPGIDQAVETEQLDASLPKWVACQMTRRVMASTLDEGPVSQHTETTGSMSASFTFVNPSGDLYITKAELKMLGAGKQRAFTVPLYRGV